MSQKSFFQQFLVTISSALSPVFLVLGAVFMISAYINREPLSAIGFFTMIFAVLFSVFTLVAVNFWILNLNADIKEAVFTAEKIAQGEIFYNLQEEEDTELKTALKQISRSIAEKSQVADRVALGDLSEDFIPNSETDVLGKSFENMICKLRNLVQTEEEREILQKSVQKLIQEIGELSSGDLAVRSEVSAQPAGEIAKAFNLMADELRTQIKLFKDISFQVETSANFIRDTIEQLERGSEAQSEQISRTADSVTETARQFQEISENASLSVQVAGDSLNNARYGTKAAQDNINAMNSIRNQVSETAKRIKKLGERSQEISHIVALIDDLSDRTGLLALNASLQAAGATESGRGFAVVAEEVERLAERSNQLTRQIAALAQTIQTETKDVVASMEETIHEVVVGSTLADKAGQSLFEIEQVSVRLSELLQSISESTRRQAQKSDDLSKGMGNISKVTEIVRNGTNRAADSIKNLTALSENLQNAVSSFKLPEDKMSHRKIQTQNNVNYLN